MAIETITLNGKDYYAEPMEHGNGFRIIGPVDKEQTLEEKLDSALTQIAELKTTLEAVQTDVSKIPKV